ncbi:hypothetical protein Smar_0542 [Staphylothermus marinus F1]|uniref:Uncharacterized protein n=1 Tax=Staphylothermus marinus (strain ATCC 43588 / DSM 3639 / JCM 9404 / F1) TaxID=399550 RepID=A3DLY9_STAMF|nr:hypothetical protein [Staphylothermus marinus]ABN69649.1 hypothetical protein Smar_0542 [Staphylothermus marinus F1]
MELHMDPSYKRALLRLIIDAGLEEDFTKWLEQQGYKYIFGRLDNIPGELIETYVKIRKLLSNEDEDEKLFREIMKMEEIEPPEKRNFIPAKKKLPR